MQLPLMVKPLNCGVDINEEINIYKKTALCAALLLEITPTIQAAEIIVDGVNCQLTDAITAANTNMAANGCDAGSNSPSVTRCIEFTR